MTHRRSHLRRPHHDPADALPEERGAPSRSRFAPDERGYDEVMAAHDAAVAAGDELYEDPITGLWAMTAPGLWNRNYCCDTGCRHCPYIER